MKLKVLTLDNRIEVRDVGFDASRYKLFFYYGSNDKFVASDGVSELPSIEIIRRATKAKIHIESGYVVEEYQGNVVVYGLRVTRQIAGNIIIRDIQVVETAVFGKNGLTRKTDWDNIPAEYSFMYVERNRKYILFNGENFGIKDGSDAVYRYYNGKFYHNGHISEMVPTVGVMETFFDKVSDGESVRWDLPVVDLGIPDDAIYSNINMQYCYVQKDGDGFIMRLFAMTGMRYFEYLRIKHDGSNAKAFTNAGIGWMETPIGNLFWSDIKSVVLVGMDDGIMETSYRYVSDFDIPADDHNGRAYWLTDKQNISNIVVATIIPAFENFLKLCKGASFAESVMHYIVHINTSIDRGLYLLFGAYDIEQTTFAKMARIPQWMVQELKNLNNDGNAVTLSITGNGIKYLKGMLNYDYLSHMDKGTFSELFPLLGRSWKMEAIGSLVSHYGKANLKAYVAYIKAFPDDQMLDYLDYLIMIHQMADEYPQYEWNIGLDEEEIIRIHNEVTGLYDLRGNKELTLRVRKKFEAERQKWDEYRFSLNGLSIVLPEKPMDIISEGLNLRHCVKSYLDAISNGETVILFIRKDNEPDKSYYTLEVKDGKIRQCHGFANSKVTPEIDAFLKEFCKEKEITYANADRVLAVA